MSSRWLAVALVLGCGSPSRTPAPSTPTPVATSPTAGAVASWAAITVTALDRSVAWYRDHLGFKPGRTIDAPKYQVRIAFLELGGFTLELIEFQQAVTPATLKARIPELEDRDHLVGFVKLGFRVADVDVLARSLEAAGITLRMKPTDDPELHDRFILVEDPDGNTLQFFAPKH